MYIENLLTGFAVAAGSLLVAVAGARAVEAMIHAAHTWAHAITVNL